MKIWSDVLLGRISIELKCPKGHEIYLACYRNARTIQRIKGLLYCPTCKKHFRDPVAKPIPVKVPE